MSDVEIWDEQWKVPARTIDMLGRQQIANIPTALHELFKNAHDAFADEVVADFYRADDTLVIRDDGDGMTPEQLSSGWLTLASSIKRGVNDARSARADGRPPRPIMGEKGIGRLAIASIGPQVLIMTRPRSENGVVHPLMASLVHWDMNRLSDIDLSLIVIPTLRVQGGGMPDAAAIRALADRLADNVEKLRSKSNGAAIDRILKNLSEIDIDPAAELGNLKGPSLANWGNGTTFVVTPTSEMLVSDLRKTDDDDVSQVEKYLLGFGNTMMPESTSPAIKVAFNDIKQDGTVDTPIEEATFFTPDELRGADHAIEGTFDPLGHFRGTIRVYGANPRTHEIAWRDSTGKPSRCGPFRINFAYLQGALKDTRLEPEAWHLMSTKLNRLGGLYVYRDGIRILPYGGPDQDFVGIERRRTKKAADWFFSYRRMIGAVEISYAENKSLREKAGREGFIRDGAYNDFVSILSCFFETLAIDFFRESSRIGDWAETRERLNENARLLNKREQSAKAKLARFNREISRFFDRIADGTFLKAASSITDDLEAGLGAIEQDRDLQRAGIAVLELERSLERRVEKLEGNLLVFKPKGAGLTKQASADWEAYGKNHAKLRSDVIVPLKAGMRERIERVIASRGLPLERRRRIGEALDRKEGRVRSINANLTRHVETGMTNLRQRIDKLLKSSDEDLRSRIAETRIEFLSTDTDAVDEAELSRLQQRWETVIEQSAQATSHLLEGLSDQLVTLMDAVERGETLDQTTDAIEARAEGLSDQLDQYVELAQLGTAVGIVQHEFSSAVGGVRNAIRKLGPWAKTNPSLGTVERDLRNGFEHLDAYLNLFAPLSRRLTATRIEVSGREIRGYLGEVFGERLQRHGIRIEATREFEAAMLPGQPSAILAAFVNLVDNAIHWTTSMPAGERLVSLDADKRGLTVSNSGPGIEPRIADRIFEHGETTRAGGRGLGLYVSREALKRSGLELTLKAAGTRKGPIFRIAPRPTDETEESNS